MAEEKQDTLYVASSSPHAHSGSSVRCIMLDVIIALVPALLASVYFFRMDAVRLVATCVFSCVIIEALCRKVMGRDIAIGDLSAVVTGLLLAFNLPPTLPTWMAIVGSVFAIIIAKQLFGGIGYNPFNPALVGRVALLIACTGPMTQWSKWFNRPDGVTGATPLGAVNDAIKAGTGVPFEFTPNMAWDFFLGDMNGCIGEVSALALIIGGLYLLYRRCISWHIPAIYLLTVFAFAGVLWMIDPTKNMPAHFHVLSGGLMLGAIFMATDMVTSPVTRSGMLVFGIGCGVLTVIFRRWNPTYPEGVSFAILLMNSVTPLIDKATKPRLFGKRKKK